MSDAARIRRNTIGDVVHRAATQYRDKVVLSFAGRDWGFREIDTARIVYASGTTAAPKGAAMTHQAMIAASRDVEEALFTHPAVSEVAAIARPDPKRIIFVDELPQYTAGKLLKRELRRIHGGDSAPWGATSA